MKRIELISMTDEYEFRKTLSMAKVSDEDKTSIIRERQKFFFENDIHKNTMSVPIGPYRDPLTGLCRFNTGR